MIDSKNENKNNPFSHSFSEKNKTTFLTCYPNLQRAIELNQNLQYFEGTKAFILYTSKNFYSAMPNKWKGQNYKGTNSISIISNMQVNSLTETIKKVQEREENFKNAIYMIGLEQEKFDNNELQTLINSFKTKNCVMLCLAETVKKELTLEIPDNVMIIYPEKNNTLEQVIEVFENISLKTLRTDVISTEIKSYDCHCLINRLNDLEIKVYCNDAPSLNHFYMMPLYLVL